MLVCSRCGSQSIVPEQKYVVGVGWVSYPKCLKCGSVKVEERWNEVKQEPQQAQEAASSPMTVLKKEERMTRKKCSYPGCDKGSWLKGLCHKHYIEKYGEYVPVKKGNGVVLPKEEPRVRVKPEAIERAVAEGRITPEKGARLLKEGHEKAKEEFAYQVSPPEPIPLIQLFLYPELLEALTAAAKKEWRTPEGEAAYLIEKGLEVKG